MKREIITGPINDEMLNKHNANYKSLFGVKESLQKQLDSLIIKDGLSNAEVVQARDGEPLLKDRLNKVDQQLADKAKQSEVVIKGQGTLNDFDETARNILMGQEPGHINAVLGKKNVKNKNVDNDAITERNISFVKNIDNIFDGNYVAGHLTGGVVGGTYTNTNADARSAVIKVLPNTTYTISKQNSDRFRFAVHNKYPVVGATVDRYIKDELSKPQYVGDLQYTFKTGANENYVIIVVTATAEEPELYLEVGAKSSYFTNVVEVNRNLTAENIKKGKNLFSKEWITGTLTADVGYVGLISTNNGKVSIVGIEPNTTYTISKSVSNRFKVGVTSTRPVVGVISIRNIFEDNNSNSHTFTSGSDDYFLVVYAAYESDPPDFMQVEKGGTQTDWETHGYKINPVAVPYFNKGEFTGFDVSLTDYAKGDGIADDTVAVQQTFNESEGAKILIPEHSIFKLRGTVYIGSHTRLEGRGETSQFILGDGFNLDSVLWRGNPEAFPIVATKKDAHDIRLKGFRITGNKKEVKLQRQYGLGLVDCHDVLVQDVISEYINYFPGVLGDGTTNTHTLGYSLALLRAYNIDILRGRYDFGGYQNLGTEDVDNVSFDKTYFGTGWRTSFQLHRGSKNIKINDITIKQNSPTAHAAFTLHGSVDSPVEDVFINGMILESITNGEIVYGGGIQTVEGNEFGVSIDNSKIHSNNIGIDINSNKVGQMKGKWKITNSDVKGERKGIEAVELNNSHIKGNTIDSDGTAIQAAGDNYKVKDNILLNNKDVILTGTNYTDNDNT